MSVFFFLGAVHKNSKECCKERQKSKKDLSTFSTHRIRARAAIRLQAKDISVRIIDVCRAYMFRPAIRGTGQSFLFPLPVFCPSKLI